MRKLEKNAKVGKIIQIDAGISRFMTPEYLIIQTFGKPLEGTILCADKNKMKTVLLSGIDKDIVVFSISTIDVDDEFLSWMRLFVCTGRNLYLFSFNKKKMWYSDQLMN